MSSILSFHLVLKVFLYTLKKPEALFNLLLLVKQLGERISINIDSL